MRKYFHFLLNFVWVFLNTVNFFDFYWIDLIIYQKPPSKILLLLKVKSDTNKNIHNLSEQKILKLKIKCRKLLNKIFQGISNKKNLKCKQLYIYIYYQKYRNMRIKIFLITYNPIFRFLTIIRHYRVPTLPIYTIENT